MRPPAGNRGVQGLGRGREQAAQASDSQGRARPPAPAPCAPCGPGGRYGPIRRAGARPRRSRRAGGSFSFLSVLLAVRHVQCVLPKKARRCQENEQSAARAAAAQVWRRRLAARVAAAAERSRARLPASCWPSCRFGIDRPLTMAASLLCTPLPAAPQPCLSARAACGRHARPQRNGRTAAMMGGDRRQGDARPGPILPPPPPPTLPQAAAQQPPRALTAHADQHQQQQQEQQPQPTPLAFSRRRAHAGLAAVAAAAALGLPRPAAATGILQFPVTELSNQVRRALHAASCQLPARWLPTHCPHPSSRPASPRTLTRTPLKLCSLARPSTHPPAHPSTFSCARGRARRRRRATCSPTPPSKRAPRRGSVRRASARCCSAPGPRCARWAWMAPPGTGRPSR